MSIIEKANPLNLQFRVCVVLNSSCSLGTIISKTLLKANALVLGIDSRPKDQSLNAGLGTHFQYEQKAPEDLSSEEVMKIVQERYDQERVDIVINVLELGQGGRLKEATPLTQGLAKVVSEGGRGTGAIITVIRDVNDVEDSQVKQAVEVSKKLTSKFGQKGVRCNIVLDAATIGADNTAYEVAKENMRALIKTEKWNISSSLTSPAGEVSEIDRRSAIDTPSSDEANQSAGILYDVGNVTLFLAGDMSEDISGAIVARYGSYRDM